ncbi:MAG: hypothetical protein ACRC33_23935 [Gemmataceae bacterium]
MLVRMKCPACQSDNVPTATACAGCGKPVKPRRRRGDEEAVALTPEGEAFVRRATWLFRSGLWSLVPVLGLALGPLTLLGALWLRGPDRPGRPLARAGLWLGLLSTVCQWAGLGFILASSGWGR